MSRSKNNKFDYGEGNYYMTIKSIPNNITLFRKTKDSARATYSKYKEVGKPIEWLGRWDGKKFVEEAPPALIVS